MNARIDMYSPEEVAKSVGVTSATICNWCRNGLINHNQIGDGEKINRYEISEDEYRHLRDLARKYGPKKVLLYYRKDWKDHKEISKPEKKKEAVKEEVKVILPEKEYSSATVARYIGLDKSSVHRWCRAERIHCRSAECERNNGHMFLIPGWEVIYIKGLYEKYGYGSGRRSPLVHYIYDIVERGSINMDWKLNMDQVEEAAKSGDNPGAIDIVNEFRKEEPKIVESSTTEKELSSFDKAWNDIREASKEEPTDDELLDNLIKVRELKRDIDNMEAKLNQMKNEYAQLKGEIVAWL